MKKLPLSVTLEAIAKKTGVSPDRIAYVKKVYEKNRHNPSALFFQIQTDTSLSKEEVSTIMAYIGAVIAKCAQDDKLNIPNNPGFSKTSYNVSQS